MTTPDASPLMVYAVGGIVLLIMLVLLMWILVTFCTGLFVAMGAMMRSMLEIFPHSPQQAPPPVQQPTYQYTPPQQSGYVDREKLNTYE